MKKLNYLALLAFIFSTIGCSQEQTGSTNATATGNKFYDSAVAKISNEIPGVSKEKAACIVDKMIADGSIGLGEINQMKFGSNQHENAKALNDTFYKVLNICIPQKKPK
ncbi:hypothetical protein [Marinicella sp. W31]|uniref:hypothetical protein n=1 Tax=Marinicella sp. W31 TaxID=3023713 RepID=UPI003757FDFD